MTPNHPANIYTSSGQAREDKAPDFGDFLAAAAEKQQERPPEKKSPEKVKRVYTMSPGQKKSLRRRYGNARFSRFEVIIDNDRIYCNNPTLTEFTRQLWEMGMLTPEEAELGAGRRPLPRDVFTAEFRDKNGSDKGGALIAAGDDYLYENSGWIDLLYPRRIPESVGDYFAYQEIILTSLRIYLSNPSYAIASMGEYFAFDPIQIKECLSAVKKISALWADTAMKDKAAAYERKRTFYRERPAVGNIIDRKIPVESSAEPYENVSRESASRNGVESGNSYGNGGRNEQLNNGNDYREAPRENASRNSAAGGNSYGNGGRNEPSNNGNDYREAPRENALQSGAASGNSHGSAGRNEPSNNGNDYREAPRENALRSGAASGNPYGSVGRNEPSNNGNGYREASRESTLRSGAVGGNPYGNDGRNEPSDNSNSSGAFREVSLEEAAGSEPKKEAPAYKEIPRDPIIHRGAAGRAKAYREIPGERSGRIEPIEAVSPREPIRGEFSGKDVAKNRRSEPSQNNVAHRESTDRVNAYQEMIRERNARKGRDK